MYIRKKALFFTVKCDKIYGEILCGKFDFFPQFFTTERGDF